MKIIFITVFGSCFSLASSVPFTVESAPIPRLVLLSGVVEPKNSATVKIRWYALIKKLGASVNQSVKKGDMLAEVSLDYLDFRKTYFEGRLGFAKANYQDAVSEEQLVKKDRDKRKTLVDKGIIAASELEKSDVALVDSALKRIRAEREVKSVQKQIEETDLQMKDSNYYAPISGVVTEVMIDPKQVSGTVIAMPDAKLARIDQPGNYVAIATALDTQAIHLVPGMKGRVVLEGTEEVVTAVISQITATASENKNGENRAGQNQGVKSFDVFLDFSRPGPILPRGYNVRVEIPYGESNKVASIPWSAVQSNNNVPTVLKYDKQKGWHETQIKLGTRGAHRVEVLSGLVPGDIVSATLW